MVTPLWRVVDRDPAPEFTAASRRDIRFVEVVPTLLPRDPLVVVLPLLKEEADERPLLLAILLFVVVPELCLPRKEEERPLA